MQSQQNSGETPQEGVPARVEPALLGELRLHILKRNAGGQEQAAWRVDYLALIARILESQGVGEKAVAPLREIAEGLSKQSKASGSATDGADWREDYTRASAEIAYLILVGEDEDDAAQHVARQLLARNVPLPARGGDARGWKRLLEFRDRVRHGQESERLQTLYRQELARLKEPRA